MTKGFTLVELSIVLVILGLLVGGVLAGQTLIRAAEVRSVVTELNHYQTAAMTFREKYFALPGDLNNATAFWGEMGDAAAGDCANDVAGTGTETCNGDNNGLIDHHSNANERFTFWQHLVNAGLIEGAYSGVQGAGGNEHAIGGVNAPSGSISTSVWYVRSRGDLSGLGTFFDGNYDRYFLFGGQDDDQEPNLRILRPAEAWGIDIKIDDGMPATGRVTLRNRDDCTNATTAAADSDNFDSAYESSDDTLRCNLVFRDYF